MSVSGIAVALYASVGFFAVSAGHSYFCKYFHDGEKRFGPTFVERGPRIDHRYGYVGAALLGVLAFSLFVNFFVVAFESFPPSTTGIAWEWYLLLLFISGFLIFVASPLMGGGAAMKWLLEGSLTLFVILLVLSVSSDASVFGQVQFVFSVSGAILASAYLVWIRAYLLPKEQLPVDSLVEAVEEFDPESGEVWALWPTVVYFVFSSVYILVGYVAVFIVLNAG